KAFGNALDIRLFKSRRITAATGTAIKTIYFRKCLLMKRRQGRKNLILRTLLENATVNFLLRPDIFLPYFGLRISNFEFSGHRYEQSFSLLSLLTNPQFEIRNPQFF